MYLLPTYYTLLDTAASLLKYVTSRGLCILHLPGGNQDRGGGEVCYQEIMHNSTAAKQEAETGAQRALQNMLSQRNTLCGVSSDSWTAPKQSELDSGYSFILTLKGVISFSYFKYKHCSKKERLILEFLDTADMSKHTVLMQPTEQHSSWIKVCAKEPCSSNFSYTDYRRVHWITENYLNHGGGEGIMLHKLLDIQRCHLGV